MAQITAETIQCPSDAPV